MTRSSLASFGIITALAWGGVALAQDAASEPRDANSSQLSQAPGKTSETTLETTTISGTLLSASGSEIVLKSDDGMETRLSVDALSGLPADLAIGGKVTVEFRTARDGSRSVTRMVSAVGTPGATTTGAGDSSAAPRLEGAMIPRAPFSPQDLLRDPTQLAWIGGIAAVLLVVLLVARRSSRKGDRILTLTGVGHHQ